MATSVLGVDLGISLPTFSNTGIGLWITIIAIIVLLTIIIAVAMYVFYQNKVYNLNIEDYENLAGQGFQRVFTDRARLIKVGDSGEEILLLKKRKQYRTAYGKKMGKNRYWFARGQDGYWYNILLGDLDAKRGMLDIDPVDRDLRYATASIRELVKDRYKKRNINTATAIVVGGIVITVLIMFVGNWFVLSKMGDLIQQASTIQGANQPVVDSITRIATHLDNICGGSGIVPA